MGIVVVAVVAFLLGVVAGAVGFYLVIALTSEEPDSIRARPRH